MIMMSQPAHKLSLAIYDWAAENHLHLSVAFRLLYSKYCSTTEKHEFMKYIYRWEYTTWEEIWTSWVDNFALTLPSLGQTYWEENVQEALDQTGTDIREITFSL